MVTYWGQMSLFLAKLVYLAANAMYQKPLINNVTNSKMQLTIFPTEHKHKTDSIN
jgi:hypothetical protein